ncbi:MAG TPA: DUF1232 domain-containing protein [Candidatus Limnocylindrales bacterium]|nr:DUF1232 domain-containing protein [Candidatus Limnocylindrales bacterium]
MEWLTGLLAAIALLVAVWLVAVGLVWLHRPSRELALPALRLLPDLLRLVRALLADGDTPRPARLALLFLLAWILSPIDLLPEFLPGIGPLDDIVVAAIVLRWVGRRLGPERLRARWSGSDEGFALLLRLLGLPAAPG